MSTSNLVVNPYVIRVLDIVSKSDEAIKRTHIIKVCRGHTGSVIAAIHEAVDDGFLKVEQVRSYDGAMGRPIDMISMTARGRQKYRRLMQQFDGIVSEKEARPVMAFDDKYTEDDLLHTMSQSANEDELYAYGDYAIAIGSVLAAKYDEYAMVSVDDFMRDTAPMYWNDKEKNDIIRMLWCSQQAHNPQLVVNMSNGDGAWYISASDAMLERLRVTYADRWAYKRDIKDTYKTYRW